MLHCFRRYEVTQDEIIIGKYTLSKLQEIRKNIDGKWDKIKDEGILREYLLQEDNIKKLKYFDKIQRQFTEGKQELNTTELIMCKRELLSALEFYGICTKEFGEPVSNEVQFLDVELGSFIINPTVEKLQEFDKKLEDFGDDKQKYKFPLAHTMSQLKFKKGL